MQQGSITLGSAAPGPDAVLSSGHPYESGPSLLLKAGMIDADENGERVLYSGLILACDAENLEDATYYVPYDSGATYGTYSDTAVGVLRSTVDASLITYPMPVVVVHGSVIQPYCYIAANGSDSRGVTAAIKTDLGDKIMWRRW